MNVDKKLAAWLNKIWRRRGLIFPEGYAAEWLAQQTDRERRRLIGLMERGAKVYSPSELRRLEATRAKTAGAAA